MSTTRESFDRAHDHTAKLADAAQKVRHIRYERMLRSHYRSAQPIKRVIEMFALMGHYAAAGYHAARAPRVSSDSHIAEHVTQYRDEIPERTHKAWYGLGIVLGKTVNVFSR